LVKTIQYKVLKKLEAVEIRRYPTMVVARVDGYGDGGFNLLFRFISGNNLQKAKVAMTAPVISEKIAMTAPVISGDGSLGFVMPEGYTAESNPPGLSTSGLGLYKSSREIWPLSSSPEVEQAHFWGQGQAVAGRAGQGGHPERRRGFLHEVQLPFTPWFMRRNEVAVEVERKG
jgi:hypothetical protein